MTHNKLLWLTLITGIQKKLGAGLTRKEIKLEKIWRFLCCPCFKLWLVEKQHTNNSNPWSRCLEVLFGVDRFCWHHNKCLIALSTSFDLSRFFTSSFYNIYQMDISVQSYCGLQTKKNKTCIAEVTKAYISKKYLEIYHIIEYSGEH